MKATELYRARLLRTAQSRAVVKICGNVFFEDSFLVAAAQPDLMGWIFSPYSKRRVSIESARRQIDAIRARWPDIFHVAIFSGNTALEMIRVVQQIPEFDFAQVSDGVGVVSQMRRHLRNYMEVIPAIRVGQVIEDGKLSAYMPFDWAVLDSFVEGLHGGTGKSIDPSFTRNVTARYLLAGGLTPDNVVERLAASSASGADVSSGVERTEGFRSGPGRKDEGKVRAFIQNVKGIPVKR